MNISLKKIKIYRTNIKDEYRLQRDKHEQELFLSRALQFYRWLRHDAQQNRSHIRNGNFALRPPCCFEGTSRCELRLSFIYRDRSQSIRLDSITIASIFRRTRAETYFSFVLALATCRTRLKMEVESNIRAESQFNFYSPLFTALTFSWRWKQKLGSLTLDWKWRLKVEWKFQDPLIIIVTLTRSVWRSKRFGKMLSGKENDWYLY